MGRVYHHEIGKRHSTNVSNVSKRGSAVLVGQPVLHVAAGEPVPPGFEGEMQKTCQIQVGASKKKKMMQFLRFIP